MNLDPGNLLQGAGLLACIGAILLVVVVAFAARSLFRPRSNRGTFQDDRDVYARRGPEEPRYDSDRIESSGGFGNAPGSRPQRGGFGIPGTGRPSSGDRLQDYRRQRGQQNDPDDDEDIRSRGGFGG